MDDINEGLRAILAGTLDLSTLPQMPSRLIRVYLCSNLQAMGQEKMVLIQNVYPRLRSYCREKYGLEFQIVDLRWGQRSELSDESQDRDLYWQEILECQNLSAGPTFVALIGQQYGHCPLPSAILEEDFLAIREAVQQHKSRDTKDASLLDQCYIRDLNSVPPVYRLQSPTNEDMSFNAGLSTEKKAKSWAEVKVSLHRLLEKGLDLCYTNGNSQRMHHYLMSDFEREIQLGILHSGDPESDCLAFCRTIIDLKNYISYEAAHKFIDVIPEAGSDKLIPDARKKERLTSLVNDEVKQWLPHTNASEFDVLWKFDDGINQELHKEYLADFSQQFENQIRRLIDKQSDIYTATPLPEMMDEVIQHWHLTQDHSSTFCRELYRDVLEQIQEYATGANQSPLVLSGIEGSGKTAVLAESAANAADWFAGESIIAVRYIGKTALSEDILQLLTSLIMQVGCLTGKSSDGIPKTFRELQAYFLMLLKKIPKNVQLVIFLDDVHIIDSKQNVPFLQWLPKQLEPNVKIIISVSSSSKNIKDCFPMNYVGEIPDPIEVQPLSPDGCMTLLQKLLDREKRSLQEDQKLVLRMAFVQCALPMYVKMVYQIAKRWPSGTNVNSLKLPTTICDCVSTMLDQLESKHGKNLVSRCLSYMVASKTGLSDCEMEDILSIDDIVLDEVYSSQHHVIRRLPSLKWLSLKNDLRPYLTCLHSEDVVVYCWSHSIFKIIIHQRYLSNEEFKKEIHSNLADYFLGVWNVGPKSYTIKSQDTMTEVQANRYVPAQPLAFACNEQELHFNKRKLDQVPRQLYLSGRLEEFNEHVLFSYEWLYNKAKALSYEHILTDFQMNPGAEASLVEKTLRDAQIFLSDNTDNMAAEITGHLLSYYNTHPNIKKLIHECDTLGLKQSAFIPTFPCHTVPGSPLKYSLSCQGKPESFAVINSRLLLAKDSQLPNVQVFDLQTGEQCSDVLTSAGRIMVTPSGKYFAIVDEDTKKSIKMHDSYTGEFLGQFIPLKHIQINPKEKYKLNNVILCETYMVAVVSADKSYLCIADLTTFRITHVRGLDGKASICAIIPDSRFIFCNAGEQLLSFDIHTMEKICDTTLELPPKQIVFRGNSLRAFVINDQESKIYVLHLKNGNIDMMYKVVLAEYFRQDGIDTLCLSNNQELLLVKGLHNMVVYHVSTENVICHISRPKQIPQEFKLPRSQQKSIHFTNAKFSADNKFVIATIFRSVYVWHTANGRLLTSMQAPVGVIANLLIPDEGGQLVTHLENSNLLQVWSLGNAIGQLPGLDRLTAPVKEVKFNLTGQQAYIRCKDSDEVGVLNLVTGQMEDLLTHATRVVSFSTSMDAKHMFIATAPGKYLQNLNKIWYLPERKIIYEFGNSPAYNTALHNSNKIISIQQESGSFKAPYHISVLTLNSGQFDVCHLENTVKFVLSEPFVTSQDKYLVFLTADDYASSSANHVNPSICAIALKNTMAMNLYSAKNLKDVVRISRLLHVRPVANNSYTVIVLFTNEPDIVDVDDHRRRTGYDYCLGFLIFDICSGVICQVLEDFVTPNTPLDSIYFSKDVSFCIDHESNMFNMGTGFYMKRVHNSKDKPRGLLLGGRAVLYTDVTCVYVVRVADCTRIAHIDVHDTITAVGIGPDDRTVVVGCEGGTLMSYVLIDEKYDDVNKIVSFIRCRSLLSNVKDRTWDQVITEETKDYQPRSMTAGPAFGPTDREYLSYVRPVSRIRPTSDTLLYLNNSSKTCSLM